MYLLIFGDSDNCFILELTGLLMSLAKKNKYSLGTPSLMRGLEKGQKCEVQFLTDPKPVETEHGSKFDIQVLLLPILILIILLLRRKERDLPGGLTVTL